VIPCEDLDELAGGIIEHDEVLHDVHQVALVEDTLEQCFHADRTRLILGKTFPLMEVPELAAHRPDLCIHAVGENNDGVMVEEVRYGVLVIAQILLVRGSDISVHVLQFHEDKGDAVDEPDDICPAAIEITSYPEFPDSEEMVVRRLIEVEGSQPLLLEIALISAKRDQHSFLKERVLVLIGGKQRLGCSGLDDLPDGFTVCIFRQAGVQLNELVAEIAGEDNLTI